MYQGKVRSSKFETKVFQSTDENLYRSGFWAQPLAQIEGNELDASFGSRWLLIDLIRPQILLLGSLLE